jgi:transposase
MNQSGVGFREIERLTGISHNTIINWVRQTKSTSDKPEFEEATESSETNEISESLDSSKTQNLVVQQIRFNNLNNYLRLT